MKRIAAVVVVIFAFMALCVGTEAVEKKVAGKADGSLISESNPQPSPLPKTVKGVQKGKQGVNPVGESNPQPSPAPKKLKKVPKKKLGKEAVSESNPQPSP